MPAAPTTAMTVTADIHLTAGELGPKMRELTKRQRAFVYARVVLGAKPVEAAIAAGYGEKSDTREQRENAARVAAFGLAQSESVGEAILEVCKKQMRASLPIATRVLVEAMDDPAVSKKDQIRAALEVSVRGGLVPQENDPAPEVQEMRGALLAEITRLADSMGLDPVRLIGQGVKVVDAEFEEVAPAPRRIPVPAELEDLI